MLELTDPFPRQADRKRNLSDRERFVTTEAEAQLDDLLLSVVEHAQDAVELFGQQSGAYQRAAGSRAGAA